MRSKFNRNVLSLEVNNRSLESEVNIKIIKKGVLFNAYIFNLESSEWKPLLHIYDSIAVVMDALEDAVPGYALRLD